MNSGYRVSSNEFEGVNKNTTEYNFVKKKFHIEESERASMTEGPPSLLFDNPDQDWIQNFVYSIGIDLSDTDETIPIFEFVFNSPEEVPKHEYETGRRGIDYYVAYIRSLCIQEDDHGVYHGPGPIGKCLESSQDQKCILFLRHIDKLPKDRQMFLKTICERGKIDMGPGIRSNTDNLFVISTTSPGTKHYEINQKLRSHLYFIPEEGLDLC